jgi:hypothetical protein
MAGFFLASLPVPYLLPAQIGVLRSVVGYFPIAGRKPATQTIACVDF